MAVFKDKVLKNQLISSILKGSGWWLSSAYGSKVGVPRPDIRMRVGRTSDGIVHEDDVGVLSSSSR